MHEYKKAEAKNEKTVRKIIKIKNKKKNNQRRKVCRFTLPKLIQARGINASSFSL